MTAGPDGRLTSGIFFRSRGESSRDGVDRERWDWEPGQAGIVLVAMFCTAKVRTRSAAAVAAAAAGCCRASTVWTSCQQHHVLEFKLKTL